MQPQIKIDNKLQDNIKLAAFCESLRAKYPLNNRVLFVQSPQFLFDSLNIEVIKNRGYYAYPPAGLQCLANSLSGRGLEIRILDLNYQFLKKVINEPLFNPDNWLDILEDCLNEYKPSIVGVTAISVYSDIFNPGFPLTAILKYLSARDDCIVMAGGPTATNETESYLNYGFCHFVIEGEGEDKIKFLFDQLFNCNGSHKATPDIHFKLDGEIEHSWGAAEAVNLKGNLIESYKTIPVEDYNNVGCLNPFSRMAGQDRPFAGIQLNRGCRADCEFCDVTKFMGKGLRQYPVKDLLDEINYLVKERGIRHFEILDDDFLGTLVFKKKTIELLEAMVEIRQEYKISWSAGNGLIAASLDEELLGLMGDSGCIGFRIGIESGNEEIQKKMRKPASLSLLRSASKILQKFPELFVAGNYIIGFFGNETFGQMLDTFKFSCEMGLDGANFTVFQFTSKSSVKKEKFQGRKTAGEFIPSKDNSKGEIIEEEGVISGPDIFNMPKDIIPDARQVKQIWFTFNLVANYINNKNLKPGGNPKKLAAWLEALQAVYPANPYMPLFSALSYALLKKRQESQKQFIKAKKNFEQSEYWKNRFAQFGLTGIINNFPCKPSEAQYQLTSLRKRYSEWIN